MGKVVILVEVANAWTAAFARLIAEQVAFTHCRVGPAARTTAASTSTASLPITDTACHPPLTIHEIRRPSSHRQP